MEDERKLEEIRKAKEEEKEDIPNKKEELEEKIENKEDTTSLNYRHQNTIILLLRQLLAPLLMDQILYLLFL